MKPHYYIFAYHSIVDNPRMVGVHGDYGTAYYRAEELTKETGHTHFVVKDVVSFRWQEMVVTEYDEF